MDTDAERRHEYFVIMSFRDRAQVEAAHVAGCTGQGVGEKARECRHAHLAARHDEFGVAAAFGDVPVYLHIVGRVVDAHRGALIARQSRIGRGISRVATDELVRA
jgi:hypothetical protein